MILKVVVNMKVIEGMQPTTKCTMIPVFLHRSCFSNFTDFAVSLCYELVGSLFLQRCYNKAFYTFLSDKNRMLRDMYIQWRQYIDVFGN